MIRREPFLFRIGIYRYIVDDEPFSYVRFFLLHVDLCDDPCPVILNILWGFIVYLKYPITKEDFFLHDFHLI